MTPGSLHGFAFYPPFLTEKKVSTTHAHTHTHHHQLYGMNIQAKVPVSIAIVEC